MYELLAPLRDHNFCLIASLNLENQMTLDLLQLVGDYLTHTIRDAHGNILATDPSFGNLVTTSESIYPVLCYEFFASMEMDTDSTDYADDGFLSFRLGGVRRRCSLFEFGRRLSLYTAPAMTLDFQQYLVASLYVINPDFDLVTFWPTVGDVCTTRRSECLVSVLLLIASLPGKVLSPLYYISICNICTPLLYVDLYVYLIYISSFLNLYFFLLQAHHHPYYSPSHGGQDESA